MSEHPTVLIVSYHYAPSPTVGAKRFSFFAREFQSFGYDIQVIADGQSDNPHGEADASVPMVGTVHRTSEALRLPLTGNSLWVRLANAVLRRILAPVGLQFFWTNHAVRMALEMAGTLRPGVVIATTPPISALIAGARIARRLGWPLIIDYRDPWSAFRWPPWQKGHIEQWLARRIEGFYVKQSAARVLNTAAMCESFDKYFPALRAQNFVIPNGFDAVPPAPPPTDSGPLEIVHAGTIYTGRTLLPVLQAVANLSARHPGRKMGVVNYGDLPPQEHERVDAAGLRPFLEVRERIPWASLFARLQRAHVLLAVVGDHMAYSAPYKVYDYLAAARPILALAPPGSALQDFISGSGAGICVNSDDEPSIERALETLLFGTIPTTERSRVDACLWSNLALQYRSVIESVLERGPLPRARKITSPSMTSLTKPTSSRVNDARNH